MKNRLVLFLILLFLAPQFYSQVIQSYGLKIGYVNSSQSYTNKDIDNITTRKNGYSVSAFLDLFNINGFSISPEIKYIQKGVGFEFIHTGSASPDPLGTETEYIYHNYLSIPFSLSYKNKFVFGTPFVKIAPRYDILLNSHDDFNSPSSTYDNFKNVFGGTFSVGFIPEFNTAVRPFIEFSYHMDFTDTYSGKYNKIRNNAFEVDLGLLL
jgi:hypothetical protein